MAEQKNRVPQVLALRAIEIRMVHRRALIDYIRYYQLRGEERDQMFSALYGPRDVIDAIVHEHRQYMMAVSSYLSTHHLIDVMHDPLGSRLLRRYKSLYASYFDLYGQIVRSQDSALADATKPLMTEVSDKLANLRERLMAERPDNSHADFDHQALLARSGRKPIEEYMVG